MPDLLTGQATPMDAKIIAGARLAQSQVQAAADEKRFTQADLNRAAVASWNEAIDIVLIHIERHNGMAMAEAIRRTISVYSLRVTP